MTKLKALPVADSAEASVEPPAFAMLHPQFVDFGCGVGNSMRFAEGIMGGPGVGVEIAPERAAGAVGKGYEVLVSDMLTFNARSVASASFAIDVFPELENRRAVETAMVAMLRAARDFAFIQHLNFDCAETLQARGESIPAMTAKSVLQKPRAIDYLNFAHQHRTSLNIVGLAAYGIGEVKGTASPIRGVSGALMSDRATAHRSLRVIIARKHINRFHAAIHMGGAGELLLYWEAED